MKTLKHVVKKKYEYYQCGDGNPMVLVHGLFGELSNFKDIIDYYSDRFRVIIPVLPLHTINLLNTHISFLAGYFAKFVKSLKLQPFFLLGNSLGGHISLLYTLKNQEKVRGLILTGSSGLYENTFGTTYFRRQDYNEVTEKVKATFFDPKHATKELVDQCFEIVNNKLKAIRLIKIARSAMKSYMGDDLPKIEVKTCLIWGNNDIVTPPLVAKEFHQKLPNSTLFFIDQCGHAPMMEVPKEFCVFLDKWLSKF